MWTTLIVKALNVSRNNNNTRNIEHTAHLWQQDSQNVHEQNKRLIKQPHNSSPPLNCCVCQISHECHAYEHVHVMMEGLPILQQIKDG